MATVNVSIPTQWVKVADVDLDFTLTLVYPNFHLVEIAVSDTDVAPTVKGHQLKSPEESFNRVLTGPGYVYARSLSNTSVTGVVTAWTSA